jgi:hypothetical protein
MATSYAKTNDRQTVVVLIPLEGYWAWESTNVIVPPPGAVSGDHEEPFESKALAEAAARKRFPDLGAFHPVPAGRDPMVEARDNPPF